jgi:dihydrofolate reductase
MIKIIAAMDKNRLIGIRGGALPWGRGLKDDLERFKILTTETGRIAMGSRTHIDDIKRPLPNRVNYVLTRQQREDFKAGVIVVHDFETLIPLFQDEDVFVIGGAEIYALALPHASELYLTRVEGEFQGDVYFPDFDESEWSLERTQRYEKSDRNTHAFTTQDWVRRK